MRILRLRWKVLFLVASWIVVYLIVQLATRLVPGVGTVIFGMVLNVIPWIVAVRVFRGGNEEVEPPRAWWRATAKPEAGFVIGGLCLAFVLIYGFQVVGGHDSAAVARAAVLYLIVGAYFFQSSVRLASRSRRSRTDVASNSDAP